MAIAQTRPRLLRQAAGHLDALRGLASEAGRLRSLASWVEQARVAEARSKRWPSQGVSPNVVSLGRQGASMPPDQVLDGLARHLGAAEQGEEE